MSRCHRRIDGPGDLRCCLSPAASISAGKCPALARIIPSPQQGQVGRVITVTGAGLRDDEVGLAYGGIARRLLNPSRCAWSLVTGLTGRPRTLA